MTSVNSAKSTENYQPAERPDIILRAQEKARCLYQTYRSIQFRIDMVELSESLKFAGLPMRQYPDFQNIGRFHDTYKAELMERYAPYTEVGFSGSAAGEYDYIFGCQLHSLEGLPEELVCVDTGLTRFACMTFRAANAEELVGGEDPGSVAMNQAMEYLRTVWLPGQREDSLFTVADLGSLCFEITAKDQPYYMNPIEIYKVDIQDDPEMCFYVPMK